MFKVELDTILVEPFRMYARIFDLSSFKEAFLIEKFQKNLLQQ